MTGLKHQSESPVCLVKDEYVFQQRLSKTDAGLLIILTRIRSALFLLMKFLATQNPSSGLLSVCELSILDT